MQGNVLPSNIFCTKRRYFVQFKWRGENFSYSLQCGFEDLTQERDRLLISCFGPAEAAARGVSAVSEYTSERFYVELFDSPEPPKVGVHDREPGLLAARRRIVAYLRRVGALKGRPELYEEADPPQEERQQAEGSEGEGAEAWSLGPRAQWAVSPAGVDHVDLPWGARRFCAALGTSTDPEAFQLWRDRALIAIHGPAAAAAHGLSRPATEYKEELFFRTLFGPGPPVEVGPYDPQPATPAARGRLRAFLRSCGALPRLETPTPAGIPPGLPPNVKRVRASWRMGPDARRTEVGFLWGALQARIVVKDGVGDEATLARARDRVAIALFGPGAAVRPGVGLCRPLEEYAGEALYAERFGGDDPPRVGLRDPEPSTPAAVVRLQRWLAERCDCFAPPTWNNRVGAIATGTGRREMMARSSSQRALGPRANPGDDAEAANVPLEDSVALPPNTYARPDYLPPPRRYFARFLLKNTPFDFILPVGVRLFTARRVRDSILLALVGPEEAVLRGLCYRLEAYQEQPFYRALFGAGEPPRVGLHDPDRHTREGKARLKAFLARNGVEIELPGAGALRKAVGRAGTGTGTLAEGTSDEAEEGGAAVPEAGAPSSPPRPKPQALAKTSLKRSAGSAAGEGSSIATRQKRRRKGPCSDTAGPAPEPRSAEPDDSAPANVPLTESMDPCDFPPNVLMTKYGTQRSRFFVSCRIRSVEAPFKFTLPAGVRLFTARRVRDSVLLALVGPEEAARRGLCYRLEAYEEQPFYGALFGSGEPPRVGLHDPSPRDREWRARLVAFLAGCGVDVAMPKRGRKRKRKAASGSGTSTSGDSSGGELAEEFEQEGGELEDEVARGEAMGDESRVQLAS